MRKNTKKNLKIIGTFYFCYLVYILWTDNIKSEQVYTGEQYKINLFVYQEYTFCIALDYEFKSPVETFEIKPGLECTSGYQEEGKISILHSCFQRSIF